ncbi:MAG TPA: hypothetical protein VNX28_05840, partial [Gemmataceae bacterium]|nr:hypothetical protein [Gemmataceae bacterium]
IVWEIATGQERCRLVAGIKRVAESTAKALVRVSPDRVSVDRFNEDWSGVGLAISQDGDLLAQAAGRTACVWDLVAGKEIARLTGHDGNVTTMTFAPNAKTLATGSADTTVLIWDVAAFLKDRKAATTVLTEADAEAHWKILAGENEAEAHRAIRALAAVSSQALPFFTKRLKPVAPVDKTEVAKWIVDLDSDKFPVRQAAIKALEMVDAQALEPVQKALKGNTSLETRRRLEQILNTVSDRPNPVTLRAVRAIAVLERIGSPEAKAVLEALARGAPGARESEEASASLDRLAQRVSKFP